jgi:V8-like Glu-specific endopeptidase
MVRVANALVAPFQCICRIVARSYDKPENEYSVGTGFLISPFHILTCAHNIYPSQAPRTKSVEVYPAQNGPDEGAARFVSNGWAVSERWRPNDCRAAAADFGIIRLASPTRNAFFQLRQFDPGLLTNRTVNLAGYPFDREPSARHMFRSTGPLIGAVVIERCERDARGGETLQRRIFPSIATTTGLIAHALASGHGVSGGPLWLEENGSRTVVGIHVRAIDNNRRGAAALLSDAVRAQAELWMTRALPPLRR